MQGDYSLVCQSKEAASRGSVVFYSTNATTSFCSGLRLGGEGSISLSLKDSNTTESSSESFADAVQSSSRRVEGQPRRRIKTVACCGSFGKRIGRLLPSQGQCGDRTIVGGYPEISRRSKNRKQHREKICRVHDGS